MATEQTVLSGKSGEDCPKTGIWKPDSFSIERLIQAGSKFPEYLHRSVTWHFVRLLAADADKH